MGNITKLKSAIDLENDFTEEEQSVFAPKKKETEKPLSMEDRIAKQYKLGMTVRGIVDQNEVSFGKVYEILSRKKVPLRNGRSKSDSRERISMMTGLEKQELVNDYKNGLPIERIFQKYRINKNGCYLILDEANVPRRYDRGGENTEPVTRITTTEKLHTTESEVETGKNEVRISESNSNKKPAIELNQIHDTLYVKINCDVGDPIEHVVVSMSADQ